jgi:ATP-dependent DNA helicase RecG
MSNLLLTYRILKGVGPNRIARKELGIHKYKDLINLYPNRYIDRTLLQNQRITKQCSRGANHW